MISELSAAYGLLESDDDLWCGVLFAHGDHFTGGLDMLDVGAELAAVSSPPRRAAAIRGGWTVTGPSPSSPPPRAG
jgi:enoyl-CoA hydratase/carnithine racemase